MVRQIKLKWEVLLGEGKRVGKGKGTRERDEREKKKGVGKTLPIPSEEQRGAAMGGGYFLKGPLNLYTDYIVWVYPAM